MSGRKNFISGLKIISGGDAATATVTSSTVNVQGLDNLSFQFNITSGTPSGTFDIYASNDHTQNAAGATLTAGTFSALGTPATKAVASGVPASFVINVPNAGFSYAQLVYTKTSGTGNFDAFFSGKAL